MATQRHKIRPPLKKFRGSTRRLAHKVRHYTQEEIEQDYRKLAEIGCLAKRTSAHVLTGNRVVDQYTFEERIHTAGHEGLNFYDIWANRASLVKRPYVRNFIQFSQSTTPNIAKEKMWYNLARFYFGAIQIFKPLVAMEYYCEFAPKCVLDPTMGWGGRLVGAYAIGVPKYIGIDQNTRLKRPYKDLVKFLDGQSMTGQKTEPTLLFQDALTVDYSQYEYDMVFTSPPYYDIEQYTGQPTRTKDEWDRDFYAPLFEKTWTHLQPGGHYVINVPIEVYERVAKRVLGPCTSKRPLKKKERRPKEGDAYTEYIYVWTKK